MTIGNRADVSAMRSIRKGQLSHGNIGLTRERYSIGNVEKHAKARI